MSLAIGAAIRSVGRLPTSRFPTAPVGDPGLFGFLGKAASFIPGPIGAIASKFFKPVVMPGIGTVSNGQIVSKFQATQQAGPPKPGIRAAAERLFPGGETGRFEIVAEQGMKLACAPGHRANKSDYFLKDGTFIQKGTKCVKNRRRNDLNPRALDRAMGRIVGAKKKEAKLKRITIRKKC